MDDVPTRHPQRASGMAAGITRLRNALGDMAEVRGPGEAPQPILAPMVRVALHQWLTEIQHASALAEVGVKARNSALLYGPPGTGKTTLAHHLAARLGIPLVLVGAENLTGKYLGQSAQSTAALFDGISKAEVPCILFLDEIDAIGSKRDSLGDTDCGAELKKAMTVLLRKVEAHSGYLVGATNRKDVIDPALWRRFSIHLSVDLPEYAERWAILKKYSLPFDLQDHQLDTLADLTEGASPALLEGLMVGMKRALVLNPKLKLNTADPAALFLPIIMSLQPPPGINPPTLWSNPHHLAALNDQLSWPPALRDRAAA